MAEFRITFARSATKEIQELDPVIARRVMAAIQKLEANPRPPGCVKLHGSEGWRLRVGDWRIVYIIDDKAALVDISAVRHRRDVYR
jgi:mRNA interferase RelE/StbE